VHALCLTSEFLCCNMFRPVCCDWLRREMNPLCLSENSILIWNFSNGPVVRKLYKKFSFYKIITYALNRDIILYDNFYCSSLGAFHVSVGSRAHAAISFCLESGSTCFSLMQFLLKIFNKGAGNVFLCFADTHHI
jgi:hypothetical protein